MEGELCPRCGAADQVAGAANPAGAPDHFLPHLRRGLKYWLFQWNSLRGVALPEGFRACLSCGLVWSSLAPQDLLEFMANPGHASAQPGKAREPELF